MRKTAVITQKKHHGSRIVIVDELKEDSSRISSICDLDQSAEKDEKMMIGNHATSSKAQQNAR